MTYEERVAEKPQWRADDRFVQEAMFEFRAENLPRIRRIIETYPGKLQENREIRQHGYCAMARHLRQFPEQEYMRWHIGQIPKESDKYLLSYMMDEIHHWPYLPEDLDVTPLLEATRDPRWLVYQSATCALSLWDKEEARTAIRPFFKLEPVRKNEPTYVYLMAAMGKLGTLEDIPPLEAQLSKANRNISGLLQGAITCIRERYPNS